MLNADFANALYGLKNAVKSLLCTLTQITMNALSVSQCLYVKGQPFLLQPSQ